MADETVLIEGYVVRSMPAAELRTHVDAHRTAIFGPDDPPATPPPPDVAATRRDLAKRLEGRVELHLGVFSDDGRFAGWHVGYQNGASQLYMQMTAILVEHRRKGLYAALLRHVVERAHALGFEVIHSHHHPANNAVIIAKLKAGFVVSGYELSDQFGTLVRLSLHLSPERRAAFRQRSGQAYGA